MCARGRPLRRRGSGRRVLEGGVDVVEVEQEAGRDPLVGVDLGEAEHLSVERLGPLIAPEETVTAENEALRTGRDDGLTLCA